MPPRPGRGKTAGSNLASHTILETLLYMNADAAVARDMAECIAEI
jgi:hypothetical protein